MAKIINLKYKDEEYTLEYNRNSVKLLTDRYNIKFDSDSALDTLIHLPEFFACAFAMHHPRMKMSKIEEILETIPDKMELVSKLLEMIIDTINTLMADGDKKEGNAVWTANWD